MKIQVEAKGTDLYAWREALEMVRVVAAVHEEKCEYDHMDIILTGEVDLESVVSTAMIAGRQGLCLESYAFGEETIALKFSMRVEAQIPF